MTERNPVKTLIIKENNLQDKQASIVEEYRMDLAKIVNDGRSTKGKNQNNFFNRMEMDFRHNCSIFEPRMVH